MTEFWKSSYWDRRFKEESEFEWLIGGDLFIKQTAPWIADPHTKAIAHIGCGNSMLSKSIHDLRGDVEIHNVDYSAEAIKRARELNGDDHQLYHSANLLDTLQLQKISPHQVDIVVDKCCADSMSTGEDVVIDYIPRSPVYALAHSLARVVKKGGWWLLCSYSPFRFEVLADCPSWEIEKRWSIPAQDASSKDDDGRVVQRPEVHHHFIALRRV